MVIATFPSPQWDRFLFNEVATDAMSTTTQQCSKSNVPLTIRPIRITDAEMEADFVRRLSPESKHFRFLGGIHELSPSMLKEFCNVDGRHSMALVATVQEDGHEIEVGVSRYSPNKDEDYREMTVTVADEWQHLGIGTLLAQQLINFAKEHGVKNLYSVDLADNIHMRQLATDLGMSCRPDPEDHHQVIYSLAL